MRDERKNIINIQFFAYKIKYCVYIAFQPKETDFIQRQH